MYYESKMKYEYPVLSTGSTQEGLSDITESLTGSLRFKTNSILIKFQFACLKTM